MTAAIGSNPSSLLGYAAGAYGAKSTSSATTSTSSTSTATTPSQSATSLTLSDEAKAYLAAMSAGTSTPSEAARAIAADARSWFDAQYEALGIGSALIDGQVAVDFSPKDRAMLAVVAANTGNQFTADETKAAATVLQARFDEAMAPHAVIARHVGDYASLYQAASDYLDAAGPEERATGTWILQKKAVTDGLAAAKASFGKAPATGNANDPVRALLDRTATSSTTSVSSTTSLASVVTDARQKLDAQANAARDAGAELVFDPTRNTGRLVDFTAFGNRSLAAMVQNQDGIFSDTEVRAARKELDQRTRTTLLKAFTDGGDSMSRSVALLKQYSSMSTEERAVLGFGDDYADTVVKNYRTVSTLQSMVDAIGASASSSFF